MGQVCIFGRHQHNGGADILVELTRPWAPHETLRNDEKNQYVRCSDDRLYAIEAVLSRIREKFFHLVQNLPFAVNTAFPVFAENSLEKLWTAVLFSELHSMFMKHD